MARLMITGRAQGLSRADFNERVKRLVANMPDPKKITRSDKSSMRTQPKRPPK